MYYLTFLWPEVEPLLRRHGFEVEATDYVGGSEMIMKCRKKQLAKLLADDVEYPRASSAA